MSLSKKIQTFGSRFAFEFFIEGMHGVIIKGLKDYLSSIKSTDIPLMVRDGKFPPLEHLDLSVVGDNVQHLEKVDLLRLMEFIAEARPDIAAEIQNLGQTGVDYLIKLRQHIINKIKGVEFKPKENTVMAHCDQCNNQWPVQKDKALSLKAEDCPFCQGKGKPKEEPKPPPEEEE